jgi:hypothetical protein
MRAYIDALRREFGTAVTILFDPQFYVTTVSPARCGNLPDYPYYEPNLTRADFIAQGDIERYVGQTLSFQATLPLDRMIAPSVRFSDFKGPWSQIALSLARQAIAAHCALADPPPLLLSLVVDETALRSRDALDEFLDIITAWDITGVYLIVRPNDPNYPALFEEVPLANLIYLVYVLAQVNGFEVVCGYSDLVGLLLHTVGAKAAGTGWFHGLRQFSLARFQPAGGGQQPRSRYTSAQLLNSILVVPELETAYRVGAIPHVLSNTSYDSVMTSGNPANAPWPLDVACLHHWEVVHEAARVVSSQASVSQNLVVLEDRIRQAIATYRLVETSGVVFEPPTGARNLAMWQRAIAGFRTDAGL